jgi:hypothetical protein
MHAMVRRSEQPKERPRSRPKTLQSVTTRAVPLAATRLAEAVSKLVEGAASGENDLSRRLAEVLEDSSIGLRTSFDTNQKGSRKRPDIRAYRTQLDKDLGLPAEVVIEAKLPHELSPGTNAADALAGQYWSSKTFPYIAENVARIEYFILTTFNEYAHVRVTREIRDAFKAELARGGGGSDALRELVRSQTKRMLLDGTEVSTQRWFAWVANHLSTQALRSVPLSSIANVHKISNEGSFERFAQQLALVAAGSQDGQHGGLFATLRDRIATSDELAPDLERDLRLFVMCQFPAAELADVDDMIRKNQALWVDEFVAASIHSLVSRLFALKVIEDRFCVGASKPLIEGALWVLNTDLYDSCSPDELLAQVGRRLKALAGSKNLIVKRMTIFGSFFDWVIKQIDPDIFRTLFELFVTADLRPVSGDLLGRFFEVYSQRVNRTKRKALGQYYTPLPLVRFMWWLASEELKSSKSFASVTVLDPGMGSGTFLANGARALADSGIAKFWERLVGFDVSPQVLGIAQVNLYTAILSRVTPSVAKDISDLRVFTTDTLDPRNGRHLKRIVSLITDESHRAFLNRSIEVSSNVKQKERFWLIIGNPPYKNNAALPLKQAAERFPSLLASSAKVGKAQQSYIRDDYAWFFGAADAYVQGRGMICFLTPDSFMFKESYALFRRELVRRYEIRQIVRLGPGLFRDVGPSISFVVTVLVRREEPLSDAALDGGPVEPPVRLYDLRAVGQLTGAGPDSGEDPRLKYVDDVAAGRQELTAPILFRPLGAHAFTLVPTDGAIVSQVGKSGVAITDVFAKKWPGIKTAFDSLFKDRSASVLGTRMRSFFTICERERRNPERRRRALEGFANEHGIDEIERLNDVARQVSEGRISFDPSRVKKSVSGSIPNHLRWYPPPEYRHHLYFEPRIRIARNDNPGKPKGWGTIDQWRTPESHMVSPKLIFTSSSNPQYGYKAFVVDDEWYAKMGGGRSQQYNYTGLSLPPHQLTISGEENNLADAGALIRNILVKSGREAVDLLHYVAGIYNSRMAEKFLESEVIGDLLIRVPSGDAEVAAVLSIVDSARKLRDLHRLLYDGPTEGEVEHEELGRLASTETISSLGLRWKRSAAAGFAATQVAQLPAGWVQAVKDHVEREQAGLDQKIDAFYS